jgi:hypothetical protein
MIRGGFLRLRPWLSRFTIQGRQYGGAYDVSEDPRLGHFFRCFPNARRILELGSLEGAHTFALAARPGVEWVQGIEGRKSNLKKAQFVQKWTGCRNVGFVNANLETFDLASLGAFDAVFCSGLLYHLPRPWELLNRLRRSAAGLLLATHYAADLQADQLVNGYRGMNYREFGLKEPLSGLSPSSFWPTLDSLKAMVNDAGYGRIELCNDDRVHPHGPLVTLAASA